RDVSAEFPHPLRDANEGCRALSAAVHHVDGVCATLRIPESRAADLGPVAGEGEMEDLLGGGGELLQIPEALCRPERAGVTEDALACEDGEVGGQLPLHDRQWLRDGKQPEVQFDLLPSVV